MILLDLAPPAEASITWGTAGIIGTMCAATGWLTWFFQSQLRAQRAMFYRVVSKHNREDDDFFEAVRGDIRELHLRNARVDGVHPAEMKPLPRRRYLIDDGGALDDEG
jgi:hypothetical protein